MPGLYLLSDKLADINTLGKVHTGGILRRLRQAEDFFQKHAKDLFDLDAAVGAMRASADETERICAGLNAASTQHAAQIKAQDRKLFDFDKAMAAAKSATTDAVTAVSAQLKQVAERGLKTASDSFEIAKTVAALTFGAEVTSKTVDMLQAQASKLESHCQSLAQRIHAHIAEYQAVATSVSGVEQAQSAFMGRVLRLEERAQIFSAVDDGHSHALNGSLALYVSPDSEISAAVLNAAAEGEATTQFGIALRTDEGKPTLWAGFAPALTPGAVTADEAIDAPTIEGEPRFRQGSVIVAITLDTDAGATKTYAVGDEITVQVQVAADDKWLGHTVSSKFWTLTVIA